MYVRAEANLGCEGAGISAEAVRVDAVAALEAAAVPLLTEREMLASPGLPELRVSLEWRRRGRGRGGLLGFGPRAAGHADDPRHADHAVRGGYLVDEHGGGWPRRLRRGKPWTRPWRPGWPSSPKRSPLRTRRTKGRGSDGRGFAGFGADTGSGHRPRWDLTVFCRLYFVGSSAVSCAPITARNSSPKRASFASPTPLRRANSSRVRGRRSTISRSVESWKTT